MPSKFRSLVVLLLLCLIAAGCRRETAAPGDPVAAVKGLAAAIRDNDLVRYSRLSLPPTLHDRMEARWKARAAAAPPPTDQEKKRYVDWMRRLTAPGAEARLYSTLDPKLGTLETEVGGQWPMMRATAGIFLNGVIQANDKLTASEKAHAREVGAAVLAWARPALIADRARARRAIAVVVETARRIDLPTLERSRALGMVPALEKGGIALEGLKRLGRIYGADADAALAGVRAEVIGVKGDIATLRVSYPWLGRTIAFDMELIRRDGRWYRADAVHDAEAELAAPVSAS